MFQGTFNEFDEDLGWNQFALRDYYPQIGRFVQRDPYQQFASPYVGMGNDPVNLIDPSGGFSVTGMAAGAVIGGMVGGVIDMVSGGSGGRGFLTGMVMGAAIGSGTGIGTLTNTLLQTANVAVQTINQAGVAKQVGTTYGNAQYASYPQSISQSNPAGWQGLYKKDLIDYYKKGNSGLTPTENDLGEFFENIWFLSMVRQAPDAVAEHRLRKNYDLWDDAEDRNTVPDFVADAGYYKYFGFKKIPVNGGSAYELKQSKKKGIYLSSYNKQIRGHIDNLAARFAAQIADGYTPNFTLVTTADVIWKPQISLYAYRRSIMFNHLVMQYRIKGNGDWEFRSISIGQQIFGN